VTWLGSLVLSAADDVRRAIAAAGGAIRFDEFVAIALYGEHGFYTGPTTSDHSTESSRTGEAVLAGRTGQAGRRGDFLTSPEVGPLFGAVIARALDTWWEELGRPDPFVVVDAGAGPGTLARAVVAAQPRCVRALAYRAVELSAAQRAMHPPTVASSATMPDHRFTGVVIANELLDNLPFRLFVQDGGWQEAYVAHDNARFVERLVTPAELPACLPMAATHGARAAVNDAARVWVESASALLERGRLVMFDYCTTSAEMAQRPWREWLRTYAGHARGVHYLSAVGEQDITVEVAIDQLPSPSHVTTQAEFLRRHGIESFVDEGRAAWQRSAPTPDLAAMTMRSRVSEAEALLDPDGLGAFSVAEWRR